MVMVMVVSVAVGAYVIAEGSTWYGPRGLAAVSAGSLCISSGFQFGCLLLALGAFLGSLGFAVLVQTPRRLNSPTMVSTICDVVSAS